MSTNMKITLTGPRRTDGVSESDFWHNFGTYLEPFNHPWSEWFVGGAAGLDTIALRWLWQNAQGHVAIVVPNELRHQPDEAQEEIRTALSRRSAFELMELRHPEIRRAPAYHARNHYMVDRSGLVIGFPHRSQPSRGTLATLKYAEDHGKDRIVCMIGTLNEVRSA